MSLSEVLPWVALRRGRLRDPTGKRRGAVGVDELLGPALKEYGRVLIWDMDGMEGGHPQLQVYRRFEGKGLWVEGGARTIGTLVDILVAGADVAVINRRRMGQVDLLAEATRLTGQLAICVEGGSELAPMGAETQSAASDLFREARRAGIDRGVYLRRPGLREMPSWIGVIEGMELYAGPVPVAAGQPKTEGRVVANLYELV